MTGKGKERRDHQCRGRQGKIIRDKQRGLGGGPRGMDAGGEKKGKKGVVVIFENFLGE